MLLNICIKEFIEIFSLRSKVLDFDVMNNPLKLKLFDTLIRPIFTYGSEIWVKDFKIKEITSDRLPLKYYKTDYLSVYLVFIRKLHILQPD